MKRDRQADITARLKGDIEELICWRNLKSRDSNNLSPEFMRCRLMTEPEYRSLAEDEEFWMCDRLNKKLVIGQWPESWRTRVGTRVIERVSHLDGLDVRGIPVVLMEEEP